MTPCSFTFEEYHDYLALALAEGYRFVSFESLAATDGHHDREILLRHDIDYGPLFMRRMAAIEAKLGISATYCLQVDSSWYRIDTPENRAAIAETLDAGHWLGLHFSASEIVSDEEVCDRIAKQAELLGREFSRDVRVVSFHMPGRRRVDHLALPGDRINTYGPQFFTDIGYVSDSNQNWRGVDFPDVVRRRVYDRLQLLIHPFWWRAEPATMRTKLFSLADELGVDPSELITYEQWDQMTQQEATTA
jgi:hypothetical protein